jgi:hypothetical protein
MEAFFGYLESRLSTIPLPSRQLCILASRKLLGHLKDEAFLESYAATLFELHEAASLSGENRMQILEMCIEAYGRAALASRDRLLAV